MMLFSRKVKSMQKQILSFVCSAAVLTAAFALSGCNLLGTGTGSSADAPQFSASAQEVAEWRTAAAQGDPVAQDNLGMAYMFGVGVPKNPRQAVRWWIKSAEQGDVGAQYNLALSYARGEGVAKNQRKAVNWFRKAAEQGSVDAQFILGAAYHDGRGVVADRREAYIWWSIAKAGDDEVAAEALAETNWRSTLSRSEIRSAQKEAARRMEAIERRKAGGPEKSAVAGGVTSAPKPKDANIAERVFENTWRSVVVVHNGSGQGSGVIIRPNIVATNCHVVDGYGGITVHKSDNRRADTGSALSATIRESDEDKDFCLLDVDGLWGVPVAVRKYNTLGVGEDVYGLGAPQGLDLSLSGGVISQ
ncbi:MAG: tetratricopeptide repeat-containing serine protease family protein, partial [Pirellulales bacterium]|nr:tetratricopeptide repeat-containing serine protease family protein [Pirellulales bacterium]